MLKHKRLIFFISLAFIFVPLMSAFADTTKIIYDEVYRVIRVESGGGTAIITAAASIHNNCFCFLIDIKTLRIYS